MNRETDRLAAFEAMLAATCKEYESTEAALRPLIAAGRERSATCRQLLARKLQLSQLLGTYRAYGLLEGSAPGKEESPCSPA